MILPSKLQELGRIRVGDQVPLAHNKGTRPRRLDAFRLTSTNKPRLAYAASLWGGEVIEWPDAPQGRQWQLYLEKDTMPVVVPPFHAISQYNEIWAGSECRLRCDGELILACPKDQAKVGQPCYCAKFPLKERLEKAKQGEACHTITRLSLVLPDLPGIGVWRLDTGSYYAGMELQGNAVLLEQASAEGCYIECLLAIEERRVVRHIGKKAQTQVFSVVTLQPQVSMRQLISRDIPAAHRIGVAQEPLAIRGPKAAADIFGGDPTDYAPAIPPMLTEGDTLGDAAPAMEEPRVDPTTGEILEPNLWEQEEAAERATAERLSP